MKIVKFLDSGIADEQAKSITDALKQNKSVEKLTLQGRRDHKEFNRKSGITVVGAKWLLR